MRQIVEAMRHAHEHGTFGLKITEDSDSNGRAWQYAGTAGRPIAYAFNCDFRAIDYEDLSAIASGKLTSKVEVVLFQNTKYVHKFMTSDDQESFETEAMIYLQLRGCDGVLELEAVVRRNGYVQGLLIPYVEGDNLCDVSIKREAERLQVTYRIMEIAAGLEKKGYYHQDLKCQNIVQRKSDGALYFIDWAQGITQGFYPPDSRDDLDDGIVEPKAGLFILGKTLLQLWTSSHPTSVDLFAIPEPARSIINDCVTNKVGTINELYKKYR